MVSARRASFDGKTLLGQRAACKAGGSVERANSFMRAEAAVETVLRRGAR